MQKSFRDCLYGEDSGLFMAVGNLSQCLKKDICDVWEIREDAAKLSVSPVFGIAVFLWYIAYGNLKVLWASEISLLWQIYKVRRLKRNMNSSRKYVKWDYDYL